MFRETGELGIKRLISSALRVIPCGFPSIRGGGSRRSPLAGFNSLNSCWISPERASGFSRAFPASLYSLRFFCAKAFLYRPAKKRINTPFIKGKLQ